MIARAMLPVSIDFRAICSDFGTFLRLTCLNNPPMINRFGFLDRRFCQSVVRR
jgi:hypothetical protein